jgi:hypothetical protein
VGGENGLEQFVFLRTIKLKRKRVDALAKTRFFVESPEWCEALTELSWQF